MTGLCLGRGAFALRRSSDFGAILCSFGFVICVRRSQLFWAGTTLAKVVAPDPTRMIQLMCDSPHTVLATSHFLLSAVRVLLSCNIGGAGGGYHRGVAQLADLVLQIAYPSTGFILLHFGTLVARTIFLDGAAVNPSLMARPAVPKSRPDGPTVSL